MSFAAGTFLGRLGRDPDTTPTTGEGSFTVLRVAVDRPTGTGDQAKVNTTWWRAKVWGTRGKTAAKHLRKGNLVIVSGWPDVREYTDEAGKQRFICELHDATWAFAESRGDQDTAQSAQTTVTAPPAPRPPAAGVDDEPPF